MNRIRPVHVEYHLTEMGHDLEPALDTVIAWSHKWIPVPAGPDDDSTSHPDQHELVAAKADR